MTDLFSMFEGETQTDEEIDDDPFGRGSFEDAPWEVTEEWGNDFCEVMVSRRISPLGSTVKDSQYVRPPNRLERFFGETFEKRLERARRWARAKADKANERANIVRAAKKR